MSEIFNWLQIW